MQTEYKGYGSFKQLGSTLSQNNFRKLLLVTFRGAFAQANTAAIINEQMAGVEAYRFDDFSVNPKFHEAQAGSALLAEHGIDAIVAIGGGSAIDTAKAINVIAANGLSGESLDPGPLKITAKSVPLIAVPTTPGTGSEATHFAVSYHKGMKYSLASPAILPDFSILDPIFTLGLDPYLTGCCAFDALSQAIESLWAIGSTQESSGFARESIHGVLANVRQAVNHPDRETRLQMLLAANLSGKAINISKTTAPHAISYPITTYFEVPHGHAVALTLGHFVALNCRLAQQGQVQDERGVKHVLATMDALLDACGLSNADQFKPFWLELMSDCGLETDPRAVGIQTDADIDRIIADVNLERMGNHPVPVQAGDIRAIFNA